jgi:hypothetical protein
MTQATLLDLAQTLVSTDSATDWLDASAVTHIDFEVRVTTMTAAAMGSENEAGIDPPGGQPIGAPSGHELIPGNGTVGEGVATGGVGGLRLFLEGQEANDDVVQLWSDLIDEPGWQIDVGVGPDLEVNVAIPPNVRLRWELSGGTATFGASITGE